MCFFKSSVWPVLVILLLFAFLASPVCAQNKKLMEEYLLDGDEYWEKELYFEAAQSYEKATQLNPDHTYATYQWAECQRMLFSYEAAEKGYAKVYYAGDKAYPLSLFYYALTQKLNGKYRQALDNFTLFSKKTGKLTEEQTLFMQRAENERKGCELGVFQQRLLSRDFAFKALEEPANSPYNDYAPIIYQHDSSLVITSGRPGGKGKLADLKLGESQSDLYPFHLESTGWKATRTDNQFDVANTKWSEGSGVFNTQRDKFYFTSCQESIESRTASEGPQNNCRIYVTNLKEGKWQEPVALNSYVNAPGYDARHPSLTLSGDTLYFASTRPGGMGMNDLWMSITAGGDNWGPPTNLGKSVNTPLNDLSPFYEPVENLLFFASDGHTGLGGLDIFMLKHQPNGSLVITNLGPPFNSNMDDYFFTSGKKVGYQASNRGSAKGRFDLYRFQLETTSTTLAVIQQAPATDQPNLVYLTAFNLDYLSAEEKLRVNRIIQRKVAGQLQGTELALSAEDAFFYQKLSSLEKIQIKNAINAQIRTQEEAKEGLEPEGGLFDYQRLPVDEKKRINRVAAAHQRALITKAPLQMSEDDQVFYERLGYQEQLQVDRLAAYRLAHPQDTDASGLPDSNIAMEFEKLPLEEQKRIKRIAQVRLTAKQTEVETALEEVDQLFYQKLSSDQKNHINNLVAYQMRQLASDEGGPYGQHERFNYQSLPIDGKGGIRIKKPLAVSAKIRTQSPEEGDMAREAFYAGEYQSITIKGRLVDMETGKPAAGVLIPLGDEKGNIIKTTKTNDDGEFQYVRLAVDQNYHLMVKDPHKRLTQQTLYQVEELEMLGFKEKAGDITFENVYFDVNQFTLRNEARKVLDELIKLCKANPGVQIEVNAFTDATGSDSYNLELSDKRGRSVVDYLSDQKIDPTTLVIKARGKGRPAASNDSPVGRQLNRRIEFVLKGAPPAYQQSPIQTCILKAATTVRTLAKDLGITVDELKQLNGFVSDRLEAYQPVRVRESAKQPLPSVLQTDKAAKNP